MRGECPRSPGQEWSPPPPPTPSPPTPTAPPAPPAHLLHPDPIFFLHFHPQRVTILRCRREYIGRRDRRRRYDAVLFPRCHMSILTTPTIFFHFVPFCSPDDYSPFMPCAPAMPFSGCLFRFLFAFVLFLLSPIIFFFFRRYIYFHIWHDMSIYSILYTCLSIRLALCRSH